MIYNTPCELAKRLPDFIAKFLALEGNLRRGTFREDSITDIILASFLNLPGSPVAVQIPFEPQSGADMDWELADPTTGAAVRYRLQAKRLRSGAKDWRRNAYRELAHPMNTGTQASALVDATNLFGSPTATPLYAFYQPDSICRLSGGLIPGVALADAHLVKSIVDEIVTSQPKRSLKRQLRFLQPLFFPLSDILCPITSLGPLRGIATPAGSAAGFERASREVRERMGSKQRDQEFRTPVVGEMSASTRIALERKAFEPVQMAEIPRVRVIFDTTYAMHILV